MSKARNIADLLDANGDVVSSALDNVPPSNDASALTTGTIDNARISLDANEIPNLDTSKITTGTLSADRIDNNSLANVTALPFSAGTDWQSTIVTGTTLTAVAGKGYWINTTSNACTVTLPASASVGDFIEFADYARTWGTNAVTLNQNSLNFQGYSSPNPEYNTNGQSVKIIYSGATQGWIPSVDDDVTLETPQSISAEYLVVAGGGSGGINDAGAGGAGGLLTNYGGTAILLSPSETYTVTVGSGGASVSSNSNGNGGNNSVLSGTGISTITAIGGGSGGKGANAGSPGGSGGGGGASSSSGGSGTVGQGNDGGYGTYSAPNYGAGGGGGAGAVGGNGTSSNGGNGGNGLSNSITGSAITYAGGGGGSTYQDTASSGSGGTGGGGAGLGAGSANGTNGLGGGGGGASGASGTSSGSGGSGVVILRVATADYSGTTTGSPTVTTDGTDTIIKFTGSGSYTA